MALLGVTEVVWNIDEQGFQSHIFGLYDTFGTEVSVVGRAQLTWYDYSDTVFISHGYTEFEADFSNENIGSFLVKRAEVPDPPSLVIFSLALVVFRLRKSVC